MIADYCIVGGGIAGTTAAENIRKLDPEARIVLLEREPHTLYSRVLIPHYLKNRIPREKVFLRSIGDYQKQNISLYTGAVVTAHDPMRHELTVKWGEGDDVCTYKKLLIASGGAPRVAPNTLSTHSDIPMLRMQTLEDADHIKTVIGSITQKDALVVGEGFIGMEFLEVFSVHGFRTKMLCRGDMFLEKRFGSVGGLILEDALQKRGVEFLKREEEQLETMMFAEKDGSTHYPSVIGVGIGLDRTLEPFEGIEKKQGIVVNEYLQTKDPDIFAAGDVALYPDALSKEPTLNGNWNGAFLQGTTAAKNIVSSLHHHEQAQMTPFTAIPVYSIVNFGFMIMMIGDMKHTDDIWERAGSIYEPFLVRIGLRNGVVVGASLINRPQLQMTIVKYIQEKTPKHVLERAI